MSKLPEQVKHFWDLPYSERRKIVFIKPESLSEKLELSWETLLFQDVIIIKHILDAVRRELKFAQPVPVEWESEFLLPPGHPRKNVLYVAHPHNERQYVPAAKFHRYLFEQKFSEAVRLLMHLGATTMQVYEQQGWGREFAANMNVSIPRADADTEASAKNTKKHTGALLFHAELEGNEEPALPADGLLWYPHESTWQNVVEGRLQFGLKSFSLVVNYADDFGVNAALEAKVKASSVELGGNFEKHEKTIWLISGTFG